MGFKPETIALRMRAVIWNGVAIEAHPIEYRFVKNRQGCEVGYVDFLRTPAPFLSANNGMLSMIFQSATGEMMPAESRALKPTRLLEMMSHNYFRTYRQFFES